MFVIIKLRYRSVNLYGKIWLNTSCSFWLLLIGREYSCMLGNERKKESMCIQKLVPCTSLCFKTNEVWECRATYLLVCVNCCMCRHLGKIHLPCVCLARTQATWTMTKARRIFSMQVMLIAEMPKQKSSIEMQVIFISNSIERQKRCKKKITSSEKLESISLLFLFFFFENKT